MEYKENTLQYDDYNRLRESVSWKNFSEKQARRALNMSQYSVSAIYNDKVIGMGRLIGDGIYYTIVDIVVDPNYQGKGVGGTLINMIIKYVEDNMSTGERVSIQLISEKGKEAFYEKMGFKKIPHENCGSGMRKVIRS